MPIQVNHEYLNANYNQIRCGVCGVDWSSHPTEIYCNRHRPPKNIVIPESVLQIVTMNLPKPKPDPNQETALKRL